MINLFVILIFIVLNVNAQAYTESTYFVNKAELSGANYKLDWNFTAMDIILRVTVRTTGWIGFGLSPNGDMSNSDVILAWTINGSVQFRDAHTVDSVTQPIVYHSVQNWQRLYYSLKNGVTTVIFKRSIKVCNPDQPASEISIDVAATQYVIFAWGTSFNKSTNLPMYHNTNRGAKFLSLLSSLNNQIKLNMTQIERLNFTVTVYKINISV